MRHQQGSVLIVALIVLMVLSTIGLSGAGSTTIEERMAGNFRDQRVAFEAAESALAAGERWVEENDIGPISTGVGACVGTQCFEPTCADGLCFNGVTGSGSYPTCSHQAPASPVWSRVNALNVWDDTSKHRVADASGQLSNSRGGARFIVEFLCFVQLDESQPILAEPHGSAAFFDKYAEMYRITAMGIGATPNSRSLVQSTYRKVR